MSEPQITEQKAEPMLEPKDILFPHDKIRDEQVLLVRDIATALAEKKNIIAHAPTGLGKTAASISPALKFALDNGLTVLFLTSRQTQHKIAVETLQDIKRIYSNDEKGNRVNELKIADIIGKKWMCGVPNISALFPNEFMEYCKSTRDSDKCTYFFKTKGSDRAQKLTLEAKKVIEDLKENICDSEAVIKACAKYELCPYEISIELAKKADVIIADYNYFFHPHINKLFFGKIGLEQEECIIVIDEAHNLPDRIRKMATSRLTSIMLKRAIKEAKKNSFNETLGNLVFIQDVLNEFSRNLETKNSDNKNNYNNHNKNSNIVEFCKASDIGNKDKNIFNNRFNNEFGRKEVKITKEDFINAIDREKNYHELLEDMNTIAESLREQQKRSFIGGIAAFLEAWKGDDEGFSRILKLEESKEGPIVTLSYTCLDPSVVTSPMLDKAYSTIFMSGTLKPTFMYRDLLGVNNSVEKEYKSPFPQKNRLNLIVPKTTTKFEKRSTQQFEEIGSTCADIVNVIKGNVFLFFPSYKMRDNVYLHFMNLCKKTIFMEDPKMSKEEKLELLERFKKYKKTGAVLLGVTSGSFGEGIDMPGDLLNGVVIVGLPLGVPDLETRELIDYFDKKYKKGWEYGYMYPAFQKTLQNAGRCIRSETDKGVIVFLDERYAWPRYRQCFPDDYDIIISKEFDGIIRNFFEKEEF